MILAPEGFAAMLAPPGPSWNVCHLTTPDTREKAYCGSRVAHHLDLPVHKAPGSKGRVCPLCGRLVCPTCRQIRKTWERGGAWEGA